MRTLPDNTPVVLDGMRVAESDIPIIHVKDPWSGRDSIAVDVGARDIQECTTVEITGYSATVDGEKTVIVTGIRQYLTANGHPFLMMPKGCTAPLDWPYMRDVPIDDSLLNRHTMAAASHSSLAARSLTSQQTTQQLPLSITLAHPVAMTNKAAASAAEYDDDGDVNPGLTTDGLLVKVYGVVTAVYPAAGYFYINDGSDLLDGSGYTGLRIASTPPALGSKVTVVGVSSTVTIGSHQARVISPVDTDAPSLTVSGTATVPCSSSLQMHVAQGTTNLVLSGSATDDLSGVSAVRVKIDTGNWQPATYDASTHEWTWTWPAPCTTTTLTVRADDFAGHYTEKEITVTLVRVVYVTPDGNYWYYDGLSWNASPGTPGQARGPFNSIQTAVDKACLMNSNAQPSDPKTEVWVEQWHADDPFNPNDTQCYCEYLELQNGVGVYGGFVGDESQREARDWKRNITTIWSGVSADGLESSDTCLDGFTITGGWRGGLYCGDSNLYVAHNIFFHNMNMLDDGDGICKGGGICVVGGSPHIVDNEISYNYGSSLYGGGVYCKESGAEISRNHIHDNAGWMYDGSFTPVYGAGIFCTGGNPTITGNLIEDNVASDAGGGIYCDSASVRISDNILAYNSCSGFYNAGGGAYVTSAATAATAFTNNTVVGNWSTEAGAMYLAGGTPTVKNNVFASNSTGVEYAPGSATNFSYNDAFSNGTENYSPSQLSGNFSFDPQFLPDGCHISASSPCAGMGDNSVLLTNETDIDGQDRLRGGTADLGADETDNCGRRIKLEFSPASAPPGQAITVTATVTDDQGDAAAQGTVVTFHTLEGVMPSQTSTSTANGVAQTTVTSSTERCLTVVASVATPCGSTQQSVRVPFFVALPVDVIFLIDVTGSMQNVSAVMTGVKATVEYLYTQLQAQGKQLRVAGLTFSDGYNVLLDPALQGSKGVFTNFTAISDAASLGSFESWLDGADFPGGETEYQLDILLFAKSLTCASHCGLYVALATNEASSSEPRLSRGDVARLLAEAGCRIFVDADTWNPLTYYNHIAIGGGAVEQDRGSGYTFSLMRQAIVGQP